MKKLILSVGAFLLSLSAANAQGYSTTGIHDDFATDTRYGGVYYWVYDSDATADALTISRPGDGTMKLIATDAGGAGKYPYLAVEFEGQQLNLSGNANIVIDIENTNEDDFTFFAVELEDADGTSSQFEPNVSDILDTSTYTYNGPPTNQWRRKALNGFDLFGGSRKTYTIDLSSVSGAVGGLTRGTEVCDGVHPKTCPNTSYELDATKIVRVRFLMNFGASNLDLSEGEGITAGDHTWDAAIPGNSIFPFTGEILIHDLKIGTFVTNTRDAALEGSLSVYPNPADAALNVSFDASSSTSVSLSDMLGNTVYTTSANAGANKIVVNTSELTSGLYILNISTENGNVSRKVTIK